MGNAIDSEEEFVVEGETALHLASTVEVVESLLTRGADMEKVDEDGRTPLVRALQGGRHGGAELYVQL